MLMNMIEKYPTQDDIAGYEMPPAARGTLPWMNEVEIAHEKSPLSELFLDVSVETREERLPFRESAELYFRNMRAVSPNYFRDIVAFERSIRSHPADIPEATLAIAVASDQEGENIYDTLREYAKQSVASEFETVLFLNKTSQGGDNGPTYAALDSFKAAYPEFAVNTFYYEFPQQMPIGFIKKILHDSVAYRHFLNGSADPVMLLGDADTRFVSPRHVEHVLAAFKDETVDIVAGHFDWDQEAFLQFPELHFATRLYQIVNHAIHVSDGHKITPGPATAMRISSYCEMGGTPAVKRGDDILHGLTVEAMRGSADTIVYPHTDAVVQASARRSVAALNQGYAPNETWKLRSLSQDMIIRNAEKTNIRRTELRDPELRLRALAKRVIDVYRPDYTDGLFEAALGELGVTATVDRNSDVTLLDFDATDALTKLHRYKDKKEQQGR